MRKPSWALAILLLTLTLASSSAAYAHTAFAQGTTTGPAANTPTPNQIDAVAKDLWCPLCNGVRLDNCELQACIQMKEVISQKLAAGEGKDQIKAYFVQQYGDVVLGAPPRQGFNLIVWIFPILAAVVGIAWVTYLIVIWRKRLPGRQAPVQASASAATEDEYLKRVERELNQRD